MLLEERDIGAVDEHVRAQREEMRLLLDGPPEVDACAEASGAGLVKDRAFQGCTINRAGQ